MPSFVPFTGLGIAEVALRGIAHCPDGRMHRWVSP
jgi:hypothetical protein